MKKFFFYLITYSLFFTTCKKNDYPEKRIEYRHGIVIDSISKAPIKDMTVYLCKRWDFGGCGYVDSAKTDDNGEYSINYSFQLNNEHDKDHYMGFSTEMNYSKNYASYHRGVSDNFSIFPLSQRLALKIYSNNHVFNVWIGDEIAYNRWGSISENGIYNKTTYHFVPPGLIKIKWHYLLVDSATEVFCKGYDTTTYFINIP